MAISAPFSAHRSAAWSSAMTRTAISGCSAWKRARRGISQREAKDGRMLTWIGPTSEPRARSPTARGEEGRDPHLDRPDLGAAAELPAGPGAGLCPVTPPVGETLALARKLEP